MQCARSAISSGVCAFTLAFLAACSRAEPVTQPIAFNHKAHIKADIDCSTCHEKAADGPAATLPPLRVCVKCHKEVQGKDPKLEEAIMDAVAKKQEIAWVQVNQVAGHVYFSHRAHVAFAEMECDVCHGDMKSQEQPVSVPNVATSMASCIECHQKKGASTDCLTCHQ